MSILKLYSKKNSFSGFDSSSSLVPFSIYEKDEVRNKTKTFKHFRISFLVSNASWNNILEQTRDATLFLNKNKEILETIKKTYNVFLAYIDFPLFSRLDNNIVNQNDYFPTDLIKIASTLEIGIQIANYNKLYLEDTNKTDMEKLLHMHDRNEPE